MVSLIPLFLTVSAAFSAAFAEPVYQLNLGGEDSLEFALLMDSFSEGKEIRDPEYPQLLLKKKWIDFKSKAISVSCVVFRSEMAAIEGGFEEIEGASCQLEFRPQQSNNEFEVLIMPGQIAVAKIYNKKIATALLENLGMQIFTSNSTTAAVGGMPKLKIECDFDVATPSVAKYCTIVAVTDVL